MKLYRHTPQRRQQITDGQAGPNAGQQQDAVVVWLGRQDRTRYRLVLTPHEARQLAGALERSAALIEPIRAEPLSLT